MTGALIKLIGVFLIMEITGLRLLADEERVSLPLSKDGSIPGWLVAGPFEQPIVGLGGIGTRDAIGETMIEPYQDKVETGALTGSGEVAWITQHTGDNGFLDFNETLGWTDPGSLPEKIWKAKVGYAAVYIDSPDEREVFLLCGSNSHLTVFLNRQEVYSVQQVRNARQDNDTIQVRLQKGMNFLLVKVGNTHQNESIQYFEPIRWEWGFFARLLDKDMQPVSQIETHLPVRRTEAGFDIVSTFFYRETDGTLQQRFDLIVTSPFPDIRSGSVKIDLPDTSYEADLERIPFGESRHMVYLPAPGADVVARAGLTISGNRIEKRITLSRTPRYEMHLMLLSHTDIGYTHPQPVVKELHMKTLDDVISLCEEHQDFTWTIETVWQLHQYELGRPAEKFDRLMDLIRAGRIAVSPVYTNPYTGWVSEEEMIRAFGKAAEYSQRYGIVYNGAVYNDVPGFAWRLPGLLSESGVRLLVAGLNELFGDYKLQRSIPKAFRWVGSDTKEVIVYRTEAYNEGQAYGLEKGGLAIEQRMWERLKKLEAQGYPYELVLMNSTIGDNGGVPKDQFLAAKQWNSEYEYPKIVFSTLSRFSEQFTERYADSLPSLSGSRFSEQFTERYADSLPSLSGDWMSTWDVLYQGEPARVARQRWTQHQLLSAEKLAVIGSLLSNDELPLGDVIDRGYESLLQYSGHGSGLEYGYGSPRDNEITMSFREEYIRNGFHAAEEALQRAIHRLTRPEESFEGEGVMVFNSLSWERDIPIEVLFPKEYFSWYSVIDMSTGLAVPAFQDSYKLFFVARNVPPVGYKKYRLVRISSRETVTGGMLGYGDDSIENAFYRIHITRSSERIDRISDLKTGENMLREGGDHPMNVLLRERFQMEESFLPLPASGFEIRIIDQRPVRIILEYIRDNHLVEKSQYILWEGVDRVDIVHSVHLDRLTATEHLEEYAFSFPFKVDAHREHVEILGGYLEPRVQRLPGAQLDAYSLRRSAAVSDDHSSITFSSIDTRVIRLRESPDGERPVLFANIVNNFPENWNRHEVNKGVLEMRFGLKRHSGPFDPGASGRFGWELNTAPVVRRSWYRSANPAGNFIGISNPNVILLSMKPAYDGEGVVYRFMNLNPAGNETARVNPVFDGGHVFASTILEVILGELPVENGMFMINLKPNEIRTIRIKHE